MSKPAICWPSASKKIDVGLPDRDADQIGAPRRAHDGVGDFRIRDQHVLDVARQVDHHRLADAELHEARGRFAGRRPGSSRLRGIGRACRRRSRAVPRPTAAPRAPQREISVARRHITRPLPTHFGVGTVLTPKRTDVDRRRAARSSSASEAWFARIREAAQRERKRAELARERERLGLARRQFERRGLADRRPSGRPSRRASDRSRARGCWRGSSR